MDALRFLGSVVLDLRQADNFFFFFWLFLFNALWFFSALSYKTALG